MGEQRKAHNVQVVKCEGWRPFERPRNVWENNTKMELELEEVTL
jgi:hypothetical protein